MQKNSFSYYSLVLLLLLLPILLLKPCGSRISYNEEFRDTVIFNVSYKDTTIYNIEKKDSTIYDYTLMPLNDTVRINDTLYLPLPLSWYWFKDESADIYCTGYNVSLDSVNYHFREVTKMVEKEITIKPKRFTADAGLSLGKIPAYYYLDIDVAARMLLNEQWSLSMTAGLISDGKTILPYGELGIRKRLR